MNHGPDFAEQARTEFERDMVADCASGCQYPDCTCPFSWGGALPVPVTACPKGYATGGLVPTQGSDDIPARLSPCPSAVPPEAVRGYGAKLLQTLRCTSPNCDCDFQPGSCRAGRPSSVEPAVWKRIVASKCRRCGEMGVCRCFTADDPVKIEPTLTVRVVRAIRRTFR